MQRSAQPHSAGQPSVLAACPRTLYAKGGERKRMTILFADIRNSTASLIVLAIPIGHAAPAPVLDLMNEAVAVTHGGRQ